MERVSPLFITELLDESELDFIGGKWRDGLYWDRHGDAFREHEGPDGEYLYERLSEDVVHEISMGRWSVEDHRADAWGREAV